ncbi:MAG: hypothetical protein HWN65_14275 [Candidatus Helarchaeota archaeon]|nr:hypothetical protein [Candidatus Helarchaeota archaeon]
MIKFSKSFYEIRTITVNDISNQVEIPILCPNASRGCSSEKLVKNGYDTSVKEHPHYFYCKDCNISFYAHTSAFFKEVELQLRECLLEFFESGKLDVAGLQATLNCSKPTISRIFQQVVNAVNGSRHLVEI